MNIDMIRAAESRIRSHIRRTPLLHSPFLDEATGRRIFVKPECLQHTGSFKFRGAMSALTALDADIRAKGVLAYSSGNHAQAVALAARMHEVPAVIVMPSDAPALKIANTRAYGAEVVLYDRETESREDIGTALAEERGLTLVKPFDYPEVIAGQGTTGLEIAAQAAELGVTEGDMLVCAGGGGLTAGIALALEADAPGLKVRPVEPEGFDDLSRSLVSGRRESNTRMTGSLCDAIVTPSPGELTFPIIQRLCGSGLLVSDDEALRAVREAFLRLKIVAEPGGAAALAAALYRDDVADTVIVTVSGGNIEPDLFVRAIG